MRSSPKMTSPPTNVHTPPKTLTPSQTPRKQPTVFSTTTPVHQTMRSTTVNLVPEANTKMNSNTVMFIIGGSTAFVVAIAVACVLIFFAHKRYRSKKTKKSPEVDQMECDPVYSDHVITSQTAISVISEASTTRPLPTCPPVACSAMEDIPHLNGCSSFDSLELYEAKTTSSEHKPFVEDGFSTLDNGDGSCGKSLTSSVYSLARSFTMGETADNDSVNSFSKPCKRRPTYDEIPNSLRKTPESSFPESTRECRLGTPDAAGSLGSLHSSCDIIDLGQANDASDFDNMDTKQQLTRRTTYEVIPENLAKMLRRESNIRDALEETNETSSDPGYEPIPLGGGLSSEPPINTRTPSRTSSIVDENPVYHMEEVSSPQPEDHCITTVMYDNSVITVDTHSTLGWLDSAAELDVASKQSLSASMEDYAGVGSVYDVPHPVYAVPQRKEHRAESAQSTLDEWSTNL